MRKTLIVLAGILAASGLLPGAVVGSGPYSFQVQQSFVNAFNRNGFSSLVNAVPVGDVRALAGSTGLIQEFTSRTNANQKLALIKPDPAEPPSATDTLQLRYDMYSAYLSVGVATAGLPQTDGIPCIGTGGSVCTYQLFSKNFALFVYSSPGVDVFRVADPIFTVWKAVDFATGALGPAVGSVTTVASSVQAAGSEQRFARGNVYAYTPTGGTAVAYAVTGTIFTAFQSYGPGILGFPTGDETTLASGLRRQFFQSGRIEYTPGSPGSVIFPLLQLYISNASTGLSLKAGETGQLQAVAIDSLGNIVTSRSLNWSTSDGSVAAVNGTGDSAVVRAVASGEARVIVTGEGITSSPITVSVAGVCCSVGEGAPIPSVVQAFRSAVARNRVTVLLPNPTPVTSVANGYVQVLSGGSGLPVAVSLASGSANAYVSQGALYAAYQSLGGFTGSLGFPASDVSAGGTQTYASGAALAGTPVVLVPSAIATRWISSGSEAGLLGVPTAPATGFVSLGSVRGTSQVFAGGSVFTSSQGTFYSYGPILSRYAALGAAAGVLGLPLGDPGLRSGTLTQVFEFGVIELAAGSATAVERLTPRVPSVKAVPSTVAPGGRVRVSVSGFVPGAVLSVTVTGQSAFQVTAAGGGFAWDIAVPSGARSGSVAIQARAATGTDTAVASYSIVTTAQLQPVLSIVSGDRQTGVPGGLMTLPLVSELLDAAGNPMAGMPVTYSASPGATALLPAVTDSNGRISGFFRLPLASGVAALSVTAGGQVVSFSALAAARSISNFPAGSGGLLGSLAALLRFHQNAGTASSTNGLASSALLTSYLAANGGLAVSDSGGTIANPWVAARFADTGVVMEKASADAIRDLLNAGIPSVAVLRLPSGVTTAVTAVSVDADGSIPALSAVGDASLTAVFRVSGPPSAGFVAVAPIAAAASAASPSGECPRLDIFDGADSGVRFLACDQEQPAWQVVAGTGRTAAVVDLTRGTSLAISGANQLVRQGIVLSASVLQPSITAAVNAAHAGTGVSPGSFASIFGSGFSSGGAIPQVTIGGTAASVVAAFPFQINVLIPPGIAPGANTLRVVGSLGTASFPVVIAGNAPGIFVLNPQQGAIVNQDGSINGPASPAQRGQVVSVYGTGLGATTLRAGLQAVTVPVTVLFNGTSLTPLFAGISPGTPGLYQVNVQIPATAVPGIGSLSLVQAGQSSNAVPVTIQ